jgi:hypothetical protein
VQFIHPQAGHGVTGVQDQGDVGARERFSGEVGAAQSGVGIMNVHRRLADLERRRPPVVVGIMERQNGVDSLVRVNGEELPRTEFEWRYADRLHLLRIYEYEVGE